MLLVSIFAVQAQSQEIYKEVKRLMQTFENISSDTKRDIQERKVAVFKADALARDYVQDLRQSSGDVGHADGNDIGVAAHKSIL